MSVQAKLIEGKSYVDVEATVTAIKKELQSNNQVEFITKQMEISRAGMIIKRIQEECNCKIKSMKTENRIETYKDKENKQRQRRVLYFKTVFAKNK